MDDKLLIHRKGVSVRSISQRMLEITDTPEGVSTRELVEAIWPDTFQKDHGRKRTEQLQRFLRSARNIMIVHEQHGRVQRIGTSEGPYNRIKSTVWRTTLDGRTWLHKSQQDDDAVDVGNPSQYSRSGPRTAFVQQYLLSQARNKYGPGTPLAERREISRALRAEGCTLQSIADVFDVSRELIRKDCLDMNVSDYRMSLEDKFTLLAEQWLKDTRIGSDASAIVEHAAYQEIIHLGIAVIPLILERLQRNHEHWFVALAAITGEDAAAGMTSVTHAAEAWIAWGRRRGYISLCKYIKALAIILRGLDLMLIYGCLRSVTALLRFPLAALLISRPL